MKRILLVSAILLTIFATGCSRYYGYGHGHGHGYGNGYGPHHYESAGWYAR